jgi:hypothetical protein
VKKKKNIKKLQARGLDQIIRDFYGENKEEAGSSKKAKKDTKACLAHPKAKKKKSYKHRKA